MTKIAPASYDRARQNVYKALAQMQRTNVEPTAANLAIWMLWSSGEDETAKTQVQSIIDAGREMSDEDARAVFRGAFAERLPEAELAGLSEKLANTLQEVLPKIQRSSIEQAQYGKLLTGIGDDISQSTSQDDVTHLVARLVTEVGAMAERSQKLEQELTQNSQELSTIRSKLKEATQASLVDQLTGLANRRCFQSKLTQYTGESRKNGEPLSLLFIDVDNFKSVNDTFGHALGDKVLAFMGRYLLKNTKGKDIAARYGGEEFAIILPETTLESATRLAESIRQAFAKYDFNLRKGGEVRKSITLSIGAAALHSDESPEDLVSRADQATYEAKRCGRNRVVSELDLPPPGA